MSLVLLEYLPHAMGTWFISGTNDVIGLVFSHSQKNVLTASSSWKMSGRANAVNKPG
jgi:hypothetical protein